MTEETFYRNLSEAPMVWADEYVGHIRSELAARPLTMAMVRTNFEHPVSVVWLGPSDTDAYLSNLLRTCDTFVVYTEPREDEGNYRWVSNKTLTEEQSGLAAWLRLE
jgi:hypothetical protein